MKIYLASKLHHAAYIRRAAENLRSCGVTIVSTWHDNLNVAEDDANSDAACRAGWEANLHQVSQEADALIAFGESTDRLNGTMIEIGMAYGRRIPIALIGDYPWGTWKILPHVSSNHTSIFDAAEELMLHRTFR